MGSSNGKPQNKGKNRKNRAKLNGKTKWTSIVNGIKLNGHPSLMAR